MSPPDNRFSVTERESKISVANEVRITEVQSDIRVEEGWVRVESGRTDIRLRKHMAYWLLGIFTGNTMGALAMIFFVGFGTMALSEKVIMSVLGATVIEAAAMLITVTKYLFPARTSSDS